MYIWIILFKGDLKMSYKTLKKYKHLITKEMSVKEFANLESIKDEICYNIKVKLQRIDNERR